MHFDDCPICQANRRAAEQGRELSPAEFLEACEQANQQGMIIGTKDGLPVIGSVLIDRES